MAQRLAVLLDAPARAAGLDPMISIFNLGDSSDYRVADGGLFRPGPDEVYVPTAALVVEVVSPNDDTWKKLDFYAARGVENHERTSFRRRAALSAKAPLRRKTPLRRTASMAASEAQRDGVAGGPCIVCGREAWIRRSASSLGWACRRTARSPAAFAAPRESRRAGVARACRADDVHHWRVGVGCGRDEYLSSSHVAVTVP